MGRHSASVLITAFQDNYAQLVRFLTRKMGGDGDCASDIAQDTYVRLATSSQNTGDIDNPRAYVYRVAGNIAIDWMRREGRISGPLTGYAPDENICDPKPSPETLALDREQIALLDQALNQLPENARRALLMFRVEGLSYAVIAARLGVSESMVAKYMSRALRHCRDELWRMDQKQGEK
ncbi:RNA polymerase sigma factor [Thalassospira sp.]|uniref:RNA polymerase sigma factor n=1 Tax=Thalassospira sp. TaxID=1912094 RepID=UPI002733B139|nr:sigma-70 family RNA polymerase sigma factor [Thalassospira sp.]MDP2696731.1 sigma-70 family RNA polymerase sigma factor [Thalassospira sp.]